MKGVLRSVSFMVCFTSSHTTELPGLCSFVGSGSSDLNQGLLGVSNLWQVFEVKT